MSKFILAMLLLCCFALIGLAQTQEKQKDDSYQPLIIKSKPRASYTNEAREKGVSGFVRLRVIFGADKKVGKIEVVSGLSGGLTEQAIRAAKGIKFKPAIRDGVPVSVTKIVEYSFSMGD